MVRVVVIQLSGSWPFIFMYQKGKESARAADQV
jgi:hypothetical protein